MRYFLAKRHEGPALFVADRIDTLQRALDDAGLAGQFHPSYTRMVPAHYVVEIALVGCPDPDPDVHALLHAGRGALPADLDEIGRRYVGALADEIAKWLRRDRSRARRRGADRRRFSGGIDSGVGVPRHVSHDAAARPVAGAAQGVRAESRRRPRRRAGARLPVRRSGCRCSSRRSTARPDDLDVERDAARARGLQVARRRVRRDGAAALPAAFAIATRSGATSPTATAATRTSRTTRSRRTRS